MRSRLPRPFLLASSALVLLGAVRTPARAEEAKKAVKFSFEEQVSAIFKNRCNGCHNADKQKGGLNLETFGTAMQGGGSGKVIEPGDLDASTLYQLVSHKDQPTMPPNAPKIPDAEIEVIKLWIEAGAPETSGSVTTVKAKPKFEFKVDAAAMGKPAGPAAMPDGLTVEPVVVSRRPTAVTALAASPWAPLVAVAGYKQVLLYQPMTQHLLGVLPFPEGSIHVLKFSRNGSLLLAGGGRGGQSGLAVVWDVKTGKRVFEVGKEYDAVLAADISSDHGLVALGGPSKILRVYNTADGQLVYQSKKHTEWVTAVEFSPDGVLLASGDRNNGLLVWEAVTGREFYDLRGHTAAITDLAWRGDSNVLASASEDGTVRVWEMENGRQIKSLTAHAGGVASARYSQDGQLVTTGRDKVARLWDANGNKLRDFEPFADLALRAVVTHEGAAVVAGDWTGEVRVWELKSGRRLGQLAANPAPLAARIERTQQELAAAEAALKGFEAVRNSAAEKAAAVARAQKSLAELEQQAAQTRSELAAAEKTLATLSATETEARQRVKAAEASLEKEKNATEEDSTPAGAATAQPSPADTLKQAQSQAEQATEDRTETARRVETLREKAQKLAGALPVGKRAVEQAAAAKLEADKALAAAQPKGDSALARTLGLRIELEALTREKNAGGVAHAGTDGPAGPGL